MQQQALPTGSEHERFDQLPNKSSTFDTLSPCLRPIRAPAGWPFFAILPLEVEGEKLK